MHSEGFLCNPGASVPPSFSRPHESLERFHITRRTALMGYRTSGMGRRMGVKERWRVKGRVRNGEMGVQGWCRRGVDW